MTVTLGILALLEAQPGIKAAVPSVDDEPATAELTTEHGLIFPVGHNADVRAIAGLTGALVNPDPSDT
jgi:hypothetical protein